MRKRLRRSRKSEITWLRFVIHCEYTCYIITINSLALFDECPRDRLQNKLVSDYRVEDFLKIDSKLHKLAHKSMNNKGGIPILKIMVGVFQRNTRTKF